MPILHTTGGSVVKDIHYDSHGNAYPAPSNLGEAVVQFDGDWDRALQDFNTTRTNTPPTVPGAAPASMQQWLIPPTTPTPIQLTGQPNNSDIEQLVRGGIGSRMAAKDVELFKGFDQAIAFDRKGTSSVITHQFSRCCSDVYGKALSEALNIAIEDRYAFAPDDEGIFTDTANLTEIIPECTNISVGYDGAHTPSETLDVEFLFALRDACLRVDWTALPIKRDPAEVDYTCYGFDYDMYGSVITSPANSKGAFGEGFDDALLTASEISAMGYHQVVKYVIKHPELTAELLQDMADEVYWANEKLNQAYDKMTCDLEEGA